MQCLAGTRLRSRRPFYILFSDHLWDMCAQMCVEAGVLGFKLQASSLDVDISAFVNNATQTGVSRFSQVDIFLFPLLFVMSKRGASPPPNGSTLIKRARSSEPQANQI